MTQRVHLEVGANFILKRQLAARHGCGTPNVTCVLFEPQPRFLNESTRKAAELGSNTYYVPFAAWIQNTTLDLYLHHDKFGVGSSIYRSSIFVKSAAKINREKNLLEKVRVPAIDLAEWIATHVPPGVHLTAHIDVEVIRKSDILRSHAPATCTCICACTRNKVCESQRAARSNSCGGKGRGGRL